MRRFIRNQSLSLVLFVLFLLFLAGLSVAGHLQHNEELNEHGQPSLAGYHGNVGILVSVVAKLAERIPGGWYDGSLLNLPAAALVC